MTQFMERFMLLLTKYNGLCVLFAGGLSALGFAPMGWWPVSLLSLAVLIYFVMRSESVKNSFRLGWLWGLGHFTITLQFLAFSFTFQDAMPVWLGYFAVLAVSLYFAIYPAIAAAATHYISRKVNRASPPKYSFEFVMIFAATWILSEWLRSVIFTGSGWNPLSASMIDTSLASLLPWIGSYGVSGLVIVTAGLALFLLKQCNLGHFKVKNYWGLAFFPLFLLFAYSGITGYTYNSVPAEDADITIVQPNISQADKYREGYNQINYAKFSELSAPLKDQNKARIILWPEAAIPDYLESGYPERAYYNTIGGSAETALAEIGKLMGPNDILLTGATRLEFENNALLGARNSVMALKKNATNDSAELFATYDKAHLIPFGEYLPLRNILEPIGLARLVPGEIDFWAGSGPATLTIPSHNKTFGGVKIGILLA